MLTISFVSTATVQVDDDMVQGLAGMRRLVQTLQDQLDSSSSTPSETDAAAASESARKPSSHAQAFALDSVRRISREMVAAKAAWALANLAANNKEGQDSIRQEGCWKNQSSKQQSVLGQLCLQ